MRKGRKRLNRKAITLAQREGRAEAVGDCPTNQLNVV
jgi:hypothetical protein